MILYLDTSALVKLYVDEEGSALVSKAVDKAAITATCEIAYVELRSALARRHRERVLQTADYRRVVRDINADWPRFFLLAVAWHLIEEAGTIAERYRLRAYDALHLAAALTIREQSQEQITFACWDRPLNNAAVEARLVPLDSAT